MFILMHCGGIPFNGDTIKERSLGGSETAAYYVARELASFGHKVTIFTNSQQEGVFDGVRYLWSGEPTEQAPLGNRFHIYAEGTPSDVLIIQRHPHAFSRKYASKRNLLWLHDLAMHRTSGALAAQMWNVDRVLVVSEFHKRQVCEVAGLNPDIVVPITNGIDLSLFEDNDAKRDPFALLYSSRPERGLLHLVKPGGIMERLQEIDPRYRLAVCGYENTTPQMEGLYNMLWDRCDALPNVANIGSLTKQELAGVMSECGALIYPTSFEEVSCITAMEAMAAGTLFLSSHHAALPETCAGSASVLLPLKDGEPDIDAFVSTVVARTQSWTRADSHKQRAAAAKYSWRLAAKRIEDVFAPEMFERSRLSVVHHFIRQSDIPAAYAAVESLTEDERESAWGKALLRELDKGYAFYRNGKFAEHYRDYYQYEKDRGVEYGPESVENNLRYHTVANFIGRLPAGSLVLDYGCAHGHFTVNLARQYPALRFVGVDITGTNVDKARAWAEAEQLTNVEFHQGDVGSVADLDLRFGAIIAAEVIEHVADPVTYIDTLCKSLAADGRMIITTPYGPWEAIGYREHQYWRAHLHHFERVDLHQCFGHHPGFGVTCVPAGFSKFGTAIGSYVTTFTKPVEESRSYSVATKLREVVPDQTLTACLIVKDAEKDIVRCLESILPHVQEVVVGVDPNTVDDTWQLLYRMMQRNPLVGWHLYDAESPVKIGFDAARNECIKHATCDWILWIDSDEVLYGGERIAGYLRENQFNGYALQQHHLAAEPAGVLKTDLPCRIFRNRRGIQFYGKVHEHPEVKMNDGIGHVSMLDGVQILHHGYSTERVRRGRFQRNIGLLEQDRKANPTRILGKFLWIRDLAQVCQYEIEAGHVDHAKFAKRAAEGFALWEELVDDGHLRMAVDALDFYSQLVALTGDGIDFVTTMDASKGLKSQPVEVAGRFANRRHIDKLVKLILDEKTKNFDSRYW